MPSPERIAEYHSRLPADWFKSGYASKANGGAGHFAYYQGPEACYICTLLGTLEAAEAERDDAQGILDRAGSRTAIAWMRRAEAAEAERDAALARVAELVETIESWTPASALARVEQLKTTLREIALLRTVPQASATADQRLTAAVNLATKALYPAGEAT